MIATATRDLISVHLKFVLSFHALSIQRIQHVRRNQIAMCTIVF